MLGLPWIRPKAAVRLPHLQVGRVLDQQLSRLARPEPSQQARRHPSWNRMALAPRTTLDRRMIPVLETALVRLVVLALQIMLVLQTVLIHQKIPVLRITPGRRVTRGLQTTKKIGAEAIEAAERTSESVRHAESAVKGAAFIAAPLLFCQHLVSLESGNFREAVVRLGCH
jgi:hypothetical protein